MQVELMFIVVCVLNLDLSTPTDSFTNKVQSPKLCLFCTESVFTVKGETFCMHVICSIQEMKDYVIYSGDGGEHLGRYIFKYCTCKQCFSAAVCY